MSKGYFYKGRWRVKHEATEWMKEIRLETLPIIKKAAKELDEIAYRAAKESCV